METMGIKTPAELLSGKKSPPSSVPAETTGSNAAVEEALYAKHMPSRYVRKIYAYGQETKRQQVDFVQTNYEH